MPGSTVNASWASVFRSTTRISPRYPESMSPGELTTPIAVASGQARARLYEPRVAVGDLDRDARRYDRALAWRQRQTLTCSEVEPGVAVVRLARHHGALTNAPDCDVDHRADASHSESPATRSGRSARSPGVATVRARARLPACLAARRSAPRARTAPRERAVRSTERAAGRPRTGPRRARRDATSSASSPSPVLAEICKARGNACPIRRRASGIEEVHLVEDELHRHVVRPDRRRARPARQRSSPAAAPREARRPRRGGRGRPRVSPRALLRIPRRAASEVAE